MSSVLFCSFYYFFFNDNQILPQSEDIQVEPNLKSPTQVGRESNKEKEEEETTRSDDA